MKLKSTTARMRVVATAFVLMMLCSCLDANRKALKVEPIREQQQRNLVEVKNESNEHPAGTTVNNHHYIPRQDFNNFGGDAGTGGSG
ncbi:hypothetical protein Tsubulata_006403 [Turnera subulata]|uniref:Uncharacterized protein n=1 Tax=Turnera subulata TaxID=218843 RepID=A0A9Q0EZM4_9ROSI|nr:hypothetical protein Tsubulata_006403 [Turnera subulata]